MPIHPEQVLLERVEEQYSIRSWFDSFGRLKVIYKEDELTREFVFQPLRPTFIVRLTPQGPVYTRSQFLIALRWGYNEEDGKEILFKVNKNDILLES
ncbi:hypothetical protein GCM10027346_02860 [Hymenobacter seoulensis]